MAAHETKPTAEDRVTAAEGRDLPERPDVGMAKPRRSRPDPRPARLMVGAGAAAALALIANGLVAVPLASDAAVPASDQTTTRARQRTARVKQRVRYVRLKPGQKAPPGAKVIREAAPAPRVVVRLVPTSRSGSPSVRSAPVGRKVVTRTRQSGG
jgi:hypothetical protein